MGKSSKKPRSMTTRGDKEGGWEKRSTWERDRITAKRDAERRAAKEARAEMRALDAPYRETLRGDRRAVLAELRTATRTPQQREFDKMLAEKEKKNEELSKLAEHQKKVVCCECGSRGEAKLVPGSEVYPQAAKSRPYVKLNYWLCDCGAYVGCHPDSDRPLGHCAGKELRTLRGKCHKVFDSLWRPTGNQKARFESRRKAYLWLTEKMHAEDALNIDVRDAHIGHMNQQEAEACLRIVTEFKNSSED